MTTPAPSRADRTTALISKRQVARIKSIFPDSNNSAIVRRALDQFLDAAEASQRRTRTAQHRRRCGKENGRRTSAGHQLVVFLMLPRELPHPHVAPMRNMPPRLRKGKCCMPHVRRADRRSRDGKPDHPAPCAHAYLEQGWRIFPVDAQKRPANARGANGPYAETAADAHRWWANGAKFGIAAATGQGLLVLDIDMPQGPASFVRLEEELGPTPPRG